MFSTLWQIQPCIIQNNFTPLIVNDPCRTVCFSYLSLPLPHRRFLNDVLILFPQLMAKSWNDINWLSKKKRQIVKNWKVQKNFCQCSANNWFPYYPLYSPQTFKWENLLHQGKTYHNLFGRPEPEDADFVLDYIDWKKILNNFVLRFIARVELKTLAWLARDVLKGHPKRKKDMKRLKVWPKQEIKYSDKRHNMKYRLAELRTAFRKSQ